MRAALSILSILLVLAFTIAGCSGGEPVVADRNVLFVGNSFTNNHDMPEMVAAITAPNGLTVRVEMIAPNGEQFREHMANEEVIERLESGEFDTVVFQEHSVISSIPAFAEENSLPAATSLFETADAAGMDVIWFQTWGHEAGYPDAGHDNYEAMQNAVNTTYELILSETGGSIARVGEAWSEFGGNVDDTSLYADDGWHSSPAGSYLAALEIAEEILGEPVALAPAVDDVDEEAAQILANS